MFGSKIGLQGKIDVLTRLSGGKRVIGFKMRLLGKIGVLKGKLSRKWDLYEKLIS